jgi:YD repeat-containing protein
MKRHSRLIFIVSSLMIFVLFAEAAPARAATKPDASAPSIASALRHVGRALSPLATVGRLVGSWFDSTFFASRAPSQPAQSPTVPGEIPWKRSATSRTVRNANGSYTFEASTVPLNYRDEDGLWQPIDNTLVTSSRPDYTWQNKANAVRTWLKDKPAHDMVAFEIEGESFTMGPIGAESTIGARQSDRASYRGLFRATDIEYVTMETGLKETLTLLSAAAPNVFRFNLNGPIESVTPVADGGLVLKRTGGKPVLIVEAPWAQEKPKGNVVVPVSTQDRHAAISATKVMGGYELTLTVDPEWLKDANFPVIVDPSVKTIQPDQSQARETYVRSDGVLAAPGVSLLVGTDTSLKTRSMVAFDTTAVEFHSIVSAATLTLTVNQCFFTCANAQTIEAHEFTAGWASWAPTWNYANANFGPTLDTAAKAAGQQSGTMSWASSSLTSVVQSWINTDKANNGFLLKAASEALAQGGPAYNSSRFGTASARPKLTVTYTANATHGYPPAAPGAATTQVDLGNTSSIDVQYPMLAPAPGRSLFRASDGTLMSIDNEGCHRMMRAAKPPYSSWSSPVELACDDLLQGFMRTDDSGTLYTVSNDLVQGIQFKRWARSGSSTNWNNNRTTGVEPTVNLPVGPLSVARTSAGRIWAAYQKNLLGDTTPTLVLKPSNDDGASFGNQVNLVRAHAAQLVAVGSDAGIVVHRFSNGKLTWRSSSAWGTETAFAETLSAGDPFQAVADDQGRVHLVYASAGGIRYRMRDATGMWTPTPGSNGTVIAATDTQPTLTTDGNTLTLLSNDSSGNIVRRTWNGSWSAPTVTVPVPPSGPLAHTNIRGALPARVSATGVLPYLWQEKDSPCPCVHFSHFDYLDQGAPGGSMSYPGEGEVLVGTITADAAPVDEVGVSRVDFFVDRGGGLLGYLGTDSTPADGFTYAWNTKEVDGSSRRLWPPGAYRLYAVAWDYKGNRGETNRPLSYVQDQDLGVRPYRPSLSVPIGAGVDAQVNLWNGNLTLSQALLSDPTVIGPLSITRTYNSQDASNGTAGRGWNAGADLDADLSFTKLIDHSADVEYPQNVAELTESDGTPHWYQFTSGTTYAPFIDDYSTLVKNSDSTWLLTMADGGRYTFNSAGDPIDYRTAEHTVDQASFAYTYTSGKLSSIVDPVGRGVTMTYDANGRLWKVTSNQASPVRTWTFTYNTTTGVLLDVQDPVNGAFTTHFDYDASNRLTDVTTPAGVRTSLATTPRPRRG